VAFFGSTKPFRVAVVAKTLVAGVVVTTGGDNVENELTLPYVVAHSLVVTVCQKYVVPAIKPEIERGLRVIAELPVNGVAALAFEGDDAVRVQLRSAPPLVAEVSP
jgi:hypothetical protein